jgi:hypothetical protein
MLFIFAGVYILIYTLIHPRLAYMYSLYYAAVFSFVCHLLYVTIFEVSYYRIDY